MGSLSGNSPQRVPGGLTCERPAAQGASRSAKRDGSGKATGAIKDVCQSGTELGFGSACEGCLLAVNKRLMSHQTNRIDEQRRFGRGGARSRLSLSMNRRADRNSTQPSRVPPSANGWPPTMSGPYNRKPPKAHTKADPSANRKAGGRNARKLARQKSERRSSAALRWAAAFAAAYSSGLGGYKQPVRSISVDLSNASSGQRVADGLDGFQLLVATASTRSMIRNDCPTTNAAPTTHSAESNNHSQNSPRAICNAKKPFVRSKATLQHSSVMAL